MARVRLLEEDEAPESAEFIAKVEGTLRIAIRLTARHAA